MQDVERKYQSQTYQPQPAVPAPRRRTPRGLLFTLVFLLLTTSAGAGAAYYFYNKAKDITRDPQATAEEETRDIIARVGLLIDLPTDEDPTVATVSDPNKLKDQAFFAKAEVGDKVLIYSKAKKAILYSPSKNKIIEVAPLSLNSETAGVSTEENNPPAGGPPPASLP